MRTNLEILLIIKKAYDREPDLRSRSGLCAVLRRLDYRNVLECGERARIFNYLKKKFGTTVSAFWWPSYDGQIRYNAICSCIDYEIGSYEQMNNLAGYWVNEKGEKLEGQEGTKYCVCKIPIKHHREDKCCVCGKILKEEKDE